MADIFISYSRKDMPFVRRVHDTFVELKRDAWVDWGGIPPSAEWLKEIFAAIDAADTFLFVVSPDSVASEMCGKEIAHAASNNKRIITVLHRDVEARDLRSPLADIQWLPFRDADDFGAAFRTLIKTIDTDLDWVRSHTRLLLRAREWQDKGRDRSFVLRGKDLVEAEQWLGRPQQAEPKPTVLQTQYIVASRQTATASQRKTIIAVSTGMVIAILLAIAAFWQREQARRQSRIASSRELVAASMNELTTDPELSVLLGLWAVADTSLRNETQTLDWENALHRAVQASRVLLTLSGHTGVVLGVAISPDGSRVATAGADKTARLWNSTTGRNLLTLTGHGDRVTAVAFSPDGHRLATASEDGTAKVWDVASGRELLAVVPGDKRLDAVVFSPDGRLLAVAGQDGLAQIRDADSGGVRLTLRGLEYEIYGIAFDPLGKRVVTAGQDGTARVWDAISGKELRRLSGHRSWVRAVAFSPDGAHLATASDDFEAKVWDIASGESMDLSGHELEVHGVAFSPDGTQVATASDDGSVKLWDFKTGRNLTTLTGHRREVYGVVFSPDGRRLATAGADGTSRVWDAEPGKELLTMSGHSRQVSSVALSPDGSLLVSVGPDATARIWDAFSGKPLRTIALGDAASNVAFDPDGRIIAPQSSTVGVWDPASGTHLSLFTGLGKRIRAVAFSPDKTRIATTYDGGTFTIWDQSGKEVVTRDGQAGEIGGLAFSPNNKLLGTAHWQNVAKVWDASSGNELLTLHTNLPTKEAPLLGIAFSPDSKRLATASRDRTSKVFDLSSEELLLNLSGHTGPLMSVAFSHDGSHLATGSGDGTAKVWDANSGAELLTLAGNLSPVNAVVFSLDDKRLITGRADGILQVYALNIGELKQLARTRLTRELSPDECRKYLHAETCPSLP